MSQDHPMNDPATLAREYGAARVRMSELAVGAGGVFIPACPDWTVHALCSHVTGIATDLSARRGPGADVQAWVDAQIESRSSLPLADVLAEWAEVGPTFEELIERKPAAFGGLLYDLVAHEHDLRHALGAPGARDSDGLVAATEMGRAMLERDLAAHHLPAVRVTIGPTTVTAGEGEPGLTLDLRDHPEPLFELFRLLGSRRSRRQLFALPWQGDLEQFLPALVHMSLPQDDLVE